MDTLGLKVGDQVFIRGAIYHYTGKVAALEDGAVRLEQAAWVADSGRWYTALQTGELSEVEPEPHGVMIPIGAIADWRPWPHALPADQK